MKALIINLDTAQHRRAFQTQQMKALQLDYQFVQAIKSQDADAKHIPSYWQTWQRPLRNSEKACFLSHHLCWQIIADENKPMLILEDDALLSQKTPDFLHQIQNEIDMDLISLETRGRKKLIANQQYSNLPIHKMFQNRDGAAAYILWPDAAKKLLDQSKTHIGIADAVLWSAYELRTFQTIPALALQADRCEHYKMPQYIETQTQIIKHEEGFDKKAGSLKQRMIYKSRRIFAQLKMAIIRIKYAKNAKWLEIVPKLADFKYLANKDTK